MSTPAKRRKPTGAQRIAALEKKVARQDETIGALAWHLHLVLAAAGRRSIFGQFEGQPTRPNLQLVGGTHGR